MVSFDRSHTSSYWRNNCGPILYHFRDINRKSRFFIPHLHSTPQLEGPRRNIAITFGVQKLEWRGYTTVEKFDDMFSRFDSSGVRQTDGQTDGI